MIKSRASKYLSCKCHLSNSANTALLHENGNICTDIVEVSDLLTVRSVLWLHLINSQIQGLLACVCVVTTCMCTHARILKRGSVSVCAVSSNKPKGHNGEGEHFLRANPQKLLFLRKCWAWSRREFFCLRYCPDIVSLRALWVNMF